MSLEHITLTIFCCQIGRDLNCFPSCSQPPPSPTKIHNYDVSQFRLAHCRKFHISFMLYLASLSIQMPSVVFMWNITQYTNVMGRKQDSKLEMGLRYREEEVLYNLTCRGHYQQNETNYEHWIFNALPHSSTT